MAFETMFHPFSFRATNRYTKPRGSGYKQWIYYVTCLHSRARSTACTKLHAKTQPITCNTIPQKDTIIPYIAQSRYPLKSHVLTIFFAFATIPATPYYPVFTDRYSPQYGMLTILLHFITNTFFFNIPPPFPSPIRFYLVSQSCSRSSPM